MPVPEFNAGIKSFRLDEALSVGGPVLCLAGRRRIDQLDHLVTVLNAPELLEQYAFVETVLFAHLVDEFIDGAPLGEIDELRIFAVAAWKVRGCMLHVLSGAALRSRWSELVLLVQPCFGRRACGVRRRPEQRQADERKGKRRAESCHGIAGEKTRRKSRRASIEHAGVMHNSPDDNRDFLSRRLPAARDGRLASRVPGAAAGH